MLDPEDKAILDFERAWWKETGAKDQAIEHCLGLTSAAYYTRLLGMLSFEGAFTYDPLTVLRVRSMIVEPLDQGVAV